MVKRLLRWVRTWLRMSLTSNIDNVSYISTLNNDKILATYTGSFTAAVGTVFVPVNTTSTITHALGLCLPIMIWSIDNVTWYDAGAPLYTEGATLVNNIEGTCYATATTIVVTARNYTTATTFYYKIAVVALS